MSPAFPDSSTELESSLQEWQLLAQLLHGEQDRAFLKRLYPAESLSASAQNIADAEISLLHALGSPDVASTQDHHEKGLALQEAIQGLLSQMQVFESISRCPILAITGLLNAGKSSLLASYLSPGNRKRVLRGLGNDAGTHRFVLWLPKVWWDDSELLSTLIGFLSSLFGHPPEHLSDDPAEAALQYNGRVLSKALMVNDHSPHEDQSDELRNPLNVPLIAYDERLNELKLGLVDCPDIQTGFLSSGSQSHGEGLANERRRQLANVGRLCSAFVIVSKMSSLHDDGLINILMTLRDAMPGVPRLLAVNKVKARYSPGTVLNETRGLIDRFSIRSVYTAYDFRSALASTLR